MAVVHELGEPVNDAERQVLRTLRDELDANWRVIGNFWVEQGNRQFECDALVVSPEGWAYLIETKGWHGRITGNDAQWELPPIAAGAAPTYPSNPVELTHKKSQILKSVLVEADSQMKSIFIAPLVVLVSDTHPDLEGRWASSVVLLSEMIQKVLKDPREYKRKPPKEAGARIAKILEVSAAPVSPPSILGQWKLVEQIEVGHLSEIWSALPRFGAENSQLVRLKKYKLDTLLTANEAELQWQKVRRDLEALEQLAGAGAAVPLQAIPEQVGDQFILVTPWPAGESLASFLQHSAHDAAEARELFLVLVHAMASVHRLEIVHRNLSPKCAHVMTDGSIQLTDFDYARLSGRTGGITGYFDTELDQTYVAPEVTADPGDATMASDVWSLGRIAADIFGGVDEHGLVILARLADPVRGIVETCLSTDPSERYATAELLESALRNEDISLDPLFDGFQTNDEIDDRYVVKGEAVPGGNLSRVYRVFDAETEAEYAAKFVRSDFQASVDPGEEYRLLRELPDHPGIVKPTFIERMKTFRRGGRQFPCSSRFLLAPWIDGTRLDKLMRDEIPEANAIELALDILRAVAHLHNNGLLHRDLKPQNIIIDKHDQKCRLVDFNVSEFADRVGGTEIGTPPYRPSDYSVGWDNTCDLYAVGVVLCEMIAGRELGSTAFSYVSESSHLVPLLKEVLITAVSPGRNDRFADAEAFQSALDAALRDMERPVISSPDVQFPEASPEDLERPNWNPYQQELMKLFSQSSTSNVGTRGLDEFGRWAYVETKLDRELVTDVAGGKYGLVMITGNAGDGKTAFIQMVERRLVEQGGFLTRRNEGNGAEIKFHSMSLVTNWDGSQDEGETDNDAVLDEFFSPFRGTSPSRPEGETRLIAINEGRLLDFVQHHADEYQWLDQTVRRMFVEERGVSTEWLCLVNLNLRSLTLPGVDGSAAIVTEVLARFSDPRLWSACSDCTASEHCYARANAAVLRDPHLGPQIADRIRAVLDVARLRRRMHISMRDLRSALAYVVVGSRSCSDIVDLVDQGDYQPVLAGHLYNSLFAASDVLEPPSRAGDATRDRLLNVVGSLDVAKTCDPDEDSRLWVLGVDALGREPYGLERSDRRLLTDLRDRIPQSAYQVMDDRVRSDLRLLHASLRRKLLLERADPDWSEMLPYSRLRLFKRMLDEVHPDDLSELAAAISNSDGLFSDVFSNRIATRLVADSDGANRSYVLHPIDDFELKTVDVSSAARYVEYSPDVVRLVNLRASDCYLDIDVDLHETLRRIRDGFTPSREEMRGAWLNLKIFKERLATLNSEALLISGADHKFREVRRAGLKMIASEVSA